MRPRLHLLTLLLIATTLTLSTSGCAHGRRAVFIEADKSVFRVGPKTKARVYFRNEEGEWELTRNKIELPEGWFVGSGK